MEFLRRHAHRGRLEAPGRNAFPARDDDTQRVLEAR